MLTQGCYDNINPKTVTDLRRRGMGTILKIIIIGGLAWGYFACVHGLSNKALAELNGIRQMYSVENIQASLAEK